MSSVVAAVQTAPRSIEVRELPRPPIGPDEAIVRVEACGICGSDISQLAGRPDIKYPVIPGHEPVGLIEEIGEVAAARRKVKVGDRVAVNAFVPCGTCRYCLSGTHEMCNGGMPNYGSSPVTLAPGLWGGYATHLYIHPQTVLHPVPAHVPGDLATLFNPLGAGLKWGVDAPGTGIGSTVVVLGCGQRGIACVIANKLAGASLIATTGLSRDRHKLDLALEFGADVAIDVEKDDVVARVLDLTGGLGVDAVIDTTPHANQPVLDALKMIRRGGTIVIGGSKELMPDFPMNEVMRKAATIKGVYGVGADHYRRAIEIIASGKLPLERLRTHAFPIDQAVRAIDTLAAADPSERVMNVVIMP